MNLFGYQFEHAWVFILLLAALALYYVLVFSARKREVIPYPPLQYKKASFIPKLMFAVHTILESLLLICLFISLAKPYHATESVSIEAKGIDIALLVDVSASMQATDFKPTRLEATKKIIKEFVRRSGGDRIGILVFAKHIFTLSPMTTDHMILQDLIDGLSLHTIDHYMSGGTALGDAILRGSDILLNSKLPERDQIIILLSDGDSNDGIETPLAARFAKENNIQVYTIGLGSDKEIDVQPDPANPGWTFTTRLVEGQLKEIAQITEANYYAAASEEILNDVFAQIAKLHQTPLEIDRLRQKKYYTYPFNVAVGIFFISAMLLRVLLLRRPLK